MPKPRKKNPETQAPSTSPSDPGANAPRAPDESVAAVERDRIARRAYELYIRRGGEGGRDLDDWLTAERELLASQGAPSGTK